MEVVMANKPTGLIKEKAIGAMLGAACGDALGWPNERVGKSRSKKLPHSRTPEFIQWFRRAGGRFYPHEELIEAGQYSDDTQLILCLSRSLQRGLNWRKYWTEVELPFWTLYECGGGGATKRAADSWIDGKAPWSEGRTPKDIKKYFDAGGNGVAMRVLPHAIYFWSAANFQDVAQHIMLDGTSTHGHPRALVGALTYGYALWRALQRDERLEYGGIVNDLLNNLQNWSVIPDLSDKCPEWQQAANKHFPNYQKIWEETIQEIKSYLFVCKNELDKGALTIDDDVLHALRCFDRKVSGAGTVAAAAAIYLASRYAPNPIQGVIKAAFSIGTDTDTIASMTGALLGAINGIDWLSSLGTTVQDSAYITKIAEQLLSDVHDIPENQIPQIRRTTLREWSERLIRLEHGSRVTLPDGRKGVVYFGSDQIGKSGRYKVFHRKVVFDDGQSLFFKKISRGEYGQERLSNGDVAQTKSRIMNFGTKLPVESIEKSTLFYQNIFGLSVKKKSQGIISFHQGLVLAPKNYCAEYLNNLGVRSLLYIEVVDIEKIYAQVKKQSNLDILTPIGPWGNTSRLFFRCTDPDGNIVEVFACER